MKKLFFIIAVSIFTLFCKAQNTLNYNDEKGSPKATLEDVSWISGIWRGEALGGICEEFWDKPSANTMMFSFKFIKNNEVVFYELGHIKEIEKSLVLEIKHFGADLKGWEKADEKQSFRLVKIDDYRVYFDQFTFERVSENEMNLYVVFEKTGEEIKFNYKRLKNE